MLSEEIFTIANKTPGDDIVRKRFLDRLHEGKLTRDEFPASHFCVYFLSYNRTNHTVFLVHHKKSGLWLSPGGHIDQGEGLLQALNREIREELGIANRFSSAPSPFLLSITPINNTRQPCKTHYDIWYMMDTDGSDFKLNEHEFHATRWLTITDAEKIVTDPANREALTILNSL